MSKVRKICTCSGDCTDCGRPRRAHSQIDTQEAERPEEFKQPEPLCLDCGHWEHEPGECEVLYFYARGLRSPPGNQRCLCGSAFKEIEEIKSNTSSEYRGKKYQPDQMIQSVQVPVGMLMPLCVKCDHPFEEHSRHESPIGALRCYARGCQCRIYMDPPKRPDGSWDLDWVPIEMRWPLSWWKRIRNRVQVGKIYILFYFLACLLVGYSIGIYVLSEPL